MAERKKRPEFPFPATERKAAFLYWDTAVGEYFHLAAAVTLDSEFNGMIGFTEKTLDRSGQEIDLPEAIHKLERHLAFLESVFLSDDLKSTGSVQLFVFEKKNDGKKYRCDEMQELWRKLGPPVHFANIGLAPSPPSGQYYKYASLKQHAERFATFAVAEEFQKNAESCIKRIRKRWIDTLPKDTTETVETWVKSEHEKFGSQENKGAPKVIIWSRQVKHDEYRNMTYATLRELVALVSSIGLVPVILGDIESESSVVEDFSSERPEVQGAWQLLGHHKKDPFKVQDSYRAQFFMLDLLHREYGVLGIMGAKSGFLDGLALMGIPVLVLESTNDPVTLAHPHETRMHSWISPVIPGYYMWPMQNIFHPEFEELRKRPLDQADKVAIAHFIWRFSKGRSKSRAELESIFTKVGTEPDTWQPVAVTVVRELLANEASALATVRKCLLDRLDGVDGEGRVESEFVRYQFKPGFDAPSPATNGET